MLNVILGHTQERRKQVSKYTSSFKFVGRGNAISNKDLNKAEKALFVETMEQRNHSNHTKGYVSVLFSVLSYCP